MLEWIVEMPNLLNNQFFFKWYTPVKNCPLSCTPKKNYHKSKTSYIWSYLGGCNYPNIRQNILKERDSLILKLLPILAQSILGVVDLSDNGSDGGRLWVSPKSRYWSESFFLKYSEATKRIVGWTFVSQNIHECQLI